MKRPMGAVNKFSKRFSYIPAEGDKNYNVYATDNKKQTHLIATIRAGLYKRAACPLWYSRSWSNSLNFIQSYAALNAAEAGLIGPV